MEIALIREYENITIVFDQPAGNRCIGTDFGTVFDGLIDHRRDDDVTSRFGRSGDASFSYGHAGDRSVTEPLPFFTAYKKRCRVTSPERGMIATRYGLGYDSENATDARSKSQILFIPATTATPHDAATSI